MLGNSESIGQPNLALIELARIAGLQGRAPPPEIARHAAPDFQDRLLQSTPSIYSHLKNLIESNEIKAPRDGSIKFPTSDFDNQNVLAAYVSGLDQFVIENNISSVNPSLRAQVLFTRGGLEGFIEGINFDEPHYSFSQNRQEFNEQVFEFRRGYELGFTVAAARDYGVILTEGEVPLNSASYSAFQAGLQAKTRPIRDQERYMKNYDLSTIPFSLDLEAAYLTGIKLWLASEGIRNIEPLEIRHPEALTAFKAALKGERIERYELEFKESPISQISVVYSRMSSFDSILGKKQRIQYGQIGYDLGKGARLARTLSKLGESQSIIKN